jgi:cell division protein FtsB
MAKTFYETGGMMALEPKSKGLTLMNKNHKQSTGKQMPNGESVEALQAELEYLRMENAYLKKLNALVQEKETLHQKTKRKLCMN